MDVGGTTYGVRVSFLTRLAGGDGTEKVNSKTVTLRDRPPPPPVEGGTSRWYLDPDDTDTRR